MPTLFHRLASPTQTPQDALKQLQSGELRGRSNRGSDILSVDGYAGPLPPGAAGTDYATPVTPDAGTSPRAVRWTVDNPGVIVVGDDYVKIPVTITRTTQLP